jgi:hypothetical protein
VEVERIKLGVPADLFKPQDKIASRREIGISAEKFVIAFSVSSLSDERKGGSILLEALNLLKLPNIRVLLIGHMDKPFAVRNIDVISLGYVDNISQLVNILNAADIFIGPSSEETLGQVFLEAAMCGTPSLAFDVSGVREAVVDGITGMTVSNMSAEALAEAISFLYATPDYVAELGRRARFYAQNEFSLEASYRSFFNAFDAGGLLDKWQIPHKISFKRDASSFFCEEKRWHGLKGVSLREGPYLEQGIYNSFRWCVGASIELQVFLDEPAKRIVLKYQNPLFDRLALDVYWDENKVTTLHAARSGHLVEDFEINLNTCDGGVHILSLVPDRQLEAMDREPRALVFQLYDLCIE